MAGASRPGSLSPACRFGPTVWMTQRAGSRPAPVVTAAPTGRPCGYAVRRTLRHSVKQGRTGGPVDRAVDATAAEQCGVGGVDDGVHLLGS